MDNKNDNNKTRVFSTEQVRAAVGSDNSRPHSASDSGSGGKSKQPLNPPKRAANPPRRADSSSRPSDSSAKPDSDRARQSGRPTQPSSGSSNKAGQSGVRPRDVHTASRRQPNDTRIAEPRKPSASSAGRAVDENAKTRQIDITRRPANSGTNPNGRAVVQNGNPVRRASNQSGARPTGQGNHADKNAVVRRGASQPSQKKRELPIDSASDYNGGDEEFSGSEAVGGALNSVLKAVIYIVSVLVVSAFLSYFGITVCNDVFAFVKDSSETVIEIPEYATVGDIAKILKENKIIRYPSIFKLYAHFRHDSGEYVAGEYTVTPSMNYDVLLSEFKEPIPERQQISITIPEGYTVDEIIELFISKGMGTREGFIDAIENYEWDYWFVLEADANRSADKKNRLEGYLFPDTYYYFTDSNETTIIYKMLENFAVKFPEELRERCSALGYSVDEIITIASMIQMEAMFPSEFPYISAVFHNRLNNPGNETQGRLQSDPTIQYALGGHEILTAENLELDSPYNTYIYKGLPPSPICNPDINAINYALYPDDVDYLYFVAEDSGYHLFASNYQDHIANRLAAGR